MTTLHLRPSINRSPLRLGLLLIPLVLVCFALSPLAQAVLPPPAPDGGYPNQNTAEGDFSLPVLTTGTDNTALGFAALDANTTGSDNTATGLGALFNNIDGAFNTATGSGALFMNNGTFNTATGIDALFDNTDGVDNTATGDSALTHNTVGIFNTAVGGQALFTNTESSNNTAVGWNALEFSDADPGDNPNTAVGSLALQHNTIGHDNNAFGFQALRTNTGGSFNNAFGEFALNVSTGDSNTAFGDEAGLNVSSGSGNTFIGQSAGEATSTASNNIAIGLNVVGDNTGHHTFIGLASGADKQTACVIGGIAGVTPAGTTQTVIINAAGQLGSMASSRRFKTDIKPMDKTSDAILALKPVTFHYKNDTATPQFGLIAEDVAEVNPDLISRDEKGEIYGVRYEAVNAMLLNEFLKEHRTVRKQQKEIDALKAELKEQKALIQKVSDKVELNKPAPQTVLNQ